MKDYRVLTSPLITLLCFGLIPFQIWVTGLIPDIDKAFGGIFIYYFPGYLLVIGFLVAISIRISLEKVKKVLGRKSILILLFSIIVIMFAPPVVETLDDYVLGIMLVLCGLLNVNLLLRTWN